MRKKKNKDDESAIKLSTDDICLAIDELARPFIEEVEVFNELDSSNSYLLGMPITPGFARICAVEAQKAGRGRRGNDWQSAPNKNIMLSLAWSFSRWPETITGLGLAVSLVVAERLNEDYDLDVKIKWPNDLLINGNKLAGILVDVAGEASGACNVVIGLGLNVHQPDWSNDDTGYQWRDLHSLGVVLDRNVFIGQISSDLVAMLQTFDKKGFVPLQERWTQLSSYAGQKISVGVGPDRVLGRMHGVDASGALILIDGNDQEHVFSDSNVSVRLQD